MPMQRPRQTEAVASVTVVINSDEKHWPHLPKGEKPGKFLKHPFAITQFNRDGKAVWPDDQFTHRRARDGDVTIEEAKKGQTGAHGSHSRAESKT